ncbi:hypothetical protein [uncultured Campylobacter sp.]|nr:hypothetical protein [uncultured Campylobacter sp.]
MHHLASQSTQGITANFTYTHMMIMPFHAQKPTISPCKFAL